MLTTGDPREVSNRPDAGVPGAGNKAIAIKHGRRIVFRDFSIKYGGHFAIIGTGIIGWTIDGIIVDTNRDALNVDASQDVTIRNSVFNSLTDDAIVLKASFGLGRMLPTQNVLIEKCTVSGYDVGSVIDKVYSTNKLIATDRDGPTARIKFGTEGTTGFNRVTIRDVIFDRSRGFALESVDGAELRDVVMTDVRMRNVSSSPIFIRLGDRGRTPVTGTNVSDAVGAEPSVRLDETGWVLPSLTDRYGHYPPIRHVPSYVRDMPVRIGGATVTDHDRQSDHADPAQSGRERAGQSADGERRRRPVRTGPQHRDSPGDDRRRRSAVPDPDRGPGRSSDRERDHQ